MPETTCTLTERLGRRAARGAAALTIALGAFGWAPGQAAFAEVLANVPSVVSTAPSSVTVAEEEAAALERALIERVNVDRAAHGLGLVQADRDLVGAARTRASDQIPLPKLSHYDASGRLVIGNILTRMKLVYQLAGENLARMQAPEAPAEEIARLAEEALMSSPTHRKNILEPSFNYLAVGVARDSSGRLVYAQLFRAA